MITITPNSNQDLIDIPDQEIVLTGPPSNLQGNIRVSNPQDELLRVRGLALITTGATGESCEAVRSSFRLKPGEAALKTFSHQMATTTTPGTYDRQIETGSVNHSVQLIVQPAVSISLHPLHLTFQGTSPGTPHAATLTLSNLGNLPFRIPSLKHTSMLDMDLLCRAFGTGFRGQANTGVTETLDEVTRNIKTNMTEWASMSVQEAGEVLQPGEHLVLHVQLTVPDDADSQRDYNANFRLWDREISVAIKSHTE